MWNFFFRNLSILTVIFSENVKGNFQKLTATSSKSCIFFDLLRELQCLSEKQNLVVPQSQKK